jgi:ElaB/YqjD/DUF883 family membrane-anchored ribosome-binding protein
MNTPSPSDSADDLKEQGGDILDGLKEAARDKVVDPVVEAGKNLSGAARDCTGKFADYGRRAAHSTDEWVDSHPYPTAGVAFIAGILLGVVVGRQIR